MRIFILFFLSLGVGFAQNNVSGLVVNQDGKPVQNALVQAPELALQTQSDENGSFTLDILLRLYSRFQQIPIKLMLLKCHLEMLSQFL